MAAGVLCWKDTPNHVRGVDDGPRGPHMGAGFKFADYEDASAAELVERWPDEADTIRTRTRR